VVRVKLDIACIRIFLTQVKVKNRVIMKIHDEQVLKIGCFKKPPSLIVR